MVPPRFTNLLPSEIRATKTGELGVRHGGRTFFRSRVFQPLPAKWLWARQMGAIMYALANIDISDELGFVVSKLPPEKIDVQEDQTTKSSLPPSALEEASFGAA